MAACMQCSQLGGPTPAFLHLCNASDEMPGLLPAQDPSPCLEALFFLQSRDQLESTSPLQGAQSDETKSDRFG